MNATRNETKRVTAEVERLTIPTYPEAPAETLPMFAENRVHQRTSGNPYPNAVVIAPVPTDRTARIHSHTP